jgi:hypothetical protein
MNVIFYGNQDLPRNTGNVVFCPRLSKNQKILVRKINNSSHKHSQRRRPDDFQILTYQTVEVSLLVAAI